MSACLPAGIQFRLVAGSIWNTCARVLKMGCSLHGERVFSGGQAPAPQGTQGQALVEAGAHLAVDIGQACLGGLQGTARGMVGTAGLASGGTGGL